MSLLLSFSLYLRNSTCFGRSLPVFRSYFAALVPVGLTNECVIVWCGVRWLIHSSRSLLSEKELECGKITPEDGQGTPETYRVAKIK
jgi:hypothetical protein